MVSCSLVVLTLHPDHAGHGYVTEAVRELIRLCFEALAQNGPADSAHHHPIAKELSPGSPSNHQDLRRLHRSRRRQLHRPAWSRDRVPGPERSREVHHHADHRRPDGRHVGNRHGCRAPLRRPAQRRPGGRGPPRRLRPARRSHRTGDPDHRPAIHGSPTQPRRGDARPGQPHAAGGVPAGPRLLPRDAATPRYRDRADRRTGGADPRRAGQRARPGRDPLDAGTTARLRRPRWHRPALLPPAP